MTGQDPTAGQEPPRGELDGVARMGLLLESEAYVRADADQRFMQRDELRGVRLLLEYQKVEMALEDQGIRSTIVLFGSARLADPDVAARRLEAAEAAQRRRPYDLAAARRVAVARRLAANSRAYETARRFARLVSERTAHLPGEFVITTGGGPGIMEAGNRGAFEAGAHSIGFNITLPHEQAPNSFITPSLCFQFRYFALRKMHFLMRAKALVAFPGGLGTLDELFDALCLLQTHKMAPMPVVLVGRSFWKRAVNFEFLAQQGTVSWEDLDLVSYAETAEEIWDIIHRAWGAP